MGTQKKNHCELLPTKEETSMRFSTPRKNLHCELLHTKKIFIANFCEQKKETSMRFSTPPTKKKLHCELLHTKKIIANFWKQKKLQCDFLPPKKASLRTSTHKENHSKLLQAK